MNVIHKTYKFRIYPNKSQEELLNKHFGCARWVYNYFLNEISNQYKQGIKYEGFYKLCIKLGELKKQDNTKWLNEVNSQSLQFALKCLDDAFKRYFKKQNKYPKFKSKKSRNSFTAPQFGKIKDGRLYIPKFKEGIKIKMDRDIKGDISKMTITRTPSGKYYVSILSKEEVNSLPKTGNQCGIDLGLKDFITISDGIKFKNNKYLKEYER